ncbi:hypothetical protein [Acinetobacter pittii]|uniref:hypothetical protein n=1 Tax=Acinetobacter pittii TaxID=48296 RepID=UPI00083830C0|nr:hypothetical protein [Acinetobacter pittii]OCY48715.1 hypothetical protein BFR81_18030 [Acinetobacter pittii]
MTKKVFLLDKNVISLLNNKKPKTEKELEMLQFIRRHDRKNYRFSALPSIIEGRVRRRESESELINTLNLENQIMLKFLKKALTDVEIINPQNSNFVKVFGNSTVLYKEPRYKKALKNFYELFKKFSVKGSIPKESMQDFAYQVIENTELLKIPKEHPIIVLLILDIFQITDKSLKTNPCNILRPQKKFKNLDEKVHNVYSDLVSVSLLSQLNFSDSGKDLSIKFLSCDEALNSYIKLFELECLHKQSDMFGKLDKFDVGIRIHSEKIKEFIGELYNKYDQQKELAKKIAV